MSLPKNWKGIFWSSDSNGDLLFSLKPEEFYDRMESVGENTKYLFAGAIFDLLLNECKEQFIEYFKFALTKWKDDHALFVSIPAIKTVREEALKSKIEEEKIDHTTSNTIGILFSGPVCYSF